MHYLRLRIPSIAVPTTMPRLLQDLVEHILDYLRDDRHSLLSSCLTCLAWLTRSRANLYRTVRFETHGQLYLLHRPPQATPSLGLLILAIEAVYHAEFTLGSHDVGVDGRAPKATPESIAVLLLSYLPQRCLARRTLVRRLAQPRDDAHIRGPDKQDPVLFGIHSSDD
ncbi:hypothetical protein C8Q80DRAFT_1213166 [Daedaleopsis nitida]|nr:hypothetical protein C8Q80DRAFT_1213166 [Daedaleopsis nitida]